MDAYVSRGVASDLIPAGTQFLVSASLAPGATAGGVRGSGPVPRESRASAWTGLLDQVRDLAATWSQPTRPAPVLTRITGGGPGQPAEIAWLWPLIGQPQRGCTATLATDHLAGELGQGGRLSALVDPGRAIPAPS